MVWKKVIKLLEDLRMNKNYEILDHLEDRDAKKDAEFYAQLEQLGNPPEEKEKL